MAPTLPGAALAPKTATERGRKNGSSEWRTAVMQPPRTDLTWGEWPPNRRRLSPLPHFLLRLQPEAGAIALRHPDGHPLLVSAVADVVQEQEGPPGRGGGADYSVPLPPFGTLGAFCRYADFVK